MKIEKEHLHLAENIIDIYKKHGKAWTELRGEQLYEKKWLDQFLALLPNNSKVLDLGCGSGKPIADYLIQHGHNLTGVDSSNIMISMARLNFPQHCWVEADMRKVNLNEKFLGLLAWDSFFHLTPNSQRNMFKQFVSFAQKGTVLMFTSGPTEGEAIGDMFGDALYHSSLSQEEYRSLLIQSGFELMMMAVEDIECAEHTVWLAKKV